MTNPTLEAQDDKVSIVESRQRGVSISHALTDDNTRTGLNIYIAPSILEDIGPNVRQSIFDAVAEFQAIKNVTMNMQIVDNIEDANIKIASDFDDSIFSSNSPFYDIAPYSMLANIAFMGIAGPYIAVDPTWENINYNTIKSAMMHELGHSIGLHHTGTDSGEHIHATPEEQSASIMNPVAISTGEFSYHDERAIQMYYAEKLPKPTRTLLIKEDNTMKIRYVNSDPNNAPYYWVRAYRYKSSGQLEDYEDFKSSVLRSNGVGNIVWENQPEGNHTYRIRGMRFRKDIKSGLSLPKDTDVNTAAVISE